MLQPGYVVKLPTSLHLSNVFLSLVCLPVVELLRQYQPIWNQIKSDGFCDISTHRAWHKRIKKAVVKEKDMDLGFKLECSERYPSVTAHLKAESIGSIIKFRLIIKPLISIDTI